MANEQEGPLTAAVLRIDSASPDHAAALVEFQQQFEATLAALGWTQRGLARMIGKQEKQLRRWKLSGDFPLDLAKSLDQRVIYSRQHPLVTSDSP